jgi:molybdate transport system ATP-binding protein
MTGRGALLTLDLAVRQGGFSLDLRWEGPLGVLGLFGPSGSGKTTVIEAIAGLRPLARGRIAVGGRVLDDTAGKMRCPTRDRGVGYAPQDAMLFPHLSVRNNVLYGAARATEAPLGEVLAMLEIEDLIDRRVPGLSGGERQRVALARALLSGPSILLLDEPLSAVDVARRRRVMARLVAWIRARALPVLHVSHDAAEIASADYVLVLEDGRLRGEGRPEEVLSAGC